MQVCVNIVCLFFKCCELVDFQANPLPGVIRNTVDGENVYEGVTIDYANDQVEVIRTVSRDL